MAQGDIAKMSTKELKRLPIIHKLINRELKQKQASEILGLCVRQIQRIIKKVKKQGDQAIAHASRGKPSGRAKPDKIKNKILHLCKTRYKGFGPTFASEKLFEIDELIIHHETLRLWFKEAGIEYKKRKGKQHRSWRERKHHFGEMIQVDGSHHHWLEGRGPKCVLMGYVDDATNTVFARFYGYEGTFPFMGSFKRYVKKYGIPYSIYIDKHSTYKSVGKPSIDDELNNREPLSKVAMALKELGVEIIYANSPQAKGRVERTFETFQDRLVKELRLRGTRTMDGANKFLTHYLPTFNRRFSKDPIEEVNFHRSLPEHIDLDSILCIKTQRCLNKDFTVAHNKKLYQVLEAVNTDKVILQERINGQLHITYKGKSLKYKQIYKRPPKPKAKPEDAPKIKKPQFVPPKGHPYRNFEYSNAYRAYIRKEQQNLKQKQKEPLLTTT